ncbi:MAG: ATP-grasp domain-containing protein [Clostridia bacterium]|nr:ATP-grasp domain-containing protein [Clostridia bacterium]
MKTKVAIIGASYLQLPLIKKAKELGYETHVFAWAANDVGEKEADYFYPISIIEKENILKKCRQIKIDGICSIASDLANITVNYVANKMGLTTNSETSIVKSTNKHIMRLTFKQNNDPSPFSMLVDKRTNLEDLNLSYPIIVKPTDRSGSRGIYKLDNKSNLENAVRAALNESFDKQALIEEYVDGNEYSVEYVSYNGKHHFLAITKKYTTGAPHFIENAHEEPAILAEEVIAKIKSIVEHALDSLEIKFGASHSEIKINKNNDIKIIEIGSRMGGDCIGSDLVYYSTGIDFVKCVLDISLGKTPDLTPKIKGRPVKSVFIFNRSDYENYLYIKNKNPNKLIKTVYLNLENLDKATDSSNRSGCYIIYND